MSKKKDVDWTIAGKKSWETRRKNLDRAKSRNAGKKAWKETIRPSEYSYVKVLSENLGIDKKSIFHHDGVPDLFVITPEGKLKFFEIKPSKGSSESRLLNPRQTKTIRDLLKNDFVEEVNIVRYEKQGKKIIYASPIKLTLSNLKDYSLKVEN